MSVVEGVLELDDVRLRVAQFLRERRRPRESRFDVFARHVPAYSPRPDEWRGANSTAYSVLLAQRLASHTSREGLEEMVEASNTLNILRLCIDHDRLAPEMPIGEFAARRMGVEQLHFNTYTQIRIDSPLDHESYKTIFDIAFFNVVFNEAEIRGHSAFRDVMRIARYAARGAAAGYIGDTMKDELRYHWDSIADQLKDIVGTYEDGEALVHEGYDLASRAALDSLQRRRQAGTRKRFKELPENKHYTPPAKPEERENPHWITLRDKYLDGKRRPDER